MKQNSIRRAHRLFAIAPACVLALANLILAAGAHAKPRSPFPPLPELVPRLHRIHFDEAFKFGLSLPNSISADYGELIESWSGYALRRDGATVKPFVLPALDTNDCLNDHPTPMNAPMNV